jgi:hypothetical protein
VNWDDPRMLEPAGDSGLFLKSLDDIWSLQVLLVQHLDAGRSVELDVPRLMDASDASTSDLGTHEVSADA